MHHVIAPYQSTVYTLRLISGNERRCEPYQEDRDIYQAW